MTIFNTKLSIRYFFKNKKYTFLNILGLSLGLVTFYIISYLVYYNISVDRYQTHYNEIYRVDQKALVSGEKMVYPCAPFALSKVLASDFPEVKKATRVMFCSEFLSSGKDRTYWEDMGIYADSNFFEMFDYEFIEGSPLTALQQPDAILLNRDLAEKYFPGQNAIGKTINFQAGINCVVTAIFKNVPGNSNFTPNFIVSSAVLRKSYQPDIDSNWDWCMASTFIMLDNKTDTALLARQITKVMHKYWTFHDGRQISLWPLKKIRMQFSERTDSRPLIALIGAIAFLVLIVANINFTNLSLSYSTSRLKEITLKKIYGASRLSISWMFIGEAIVFSFVALIVALSLSEILLPWLNKALDLNLFSPKWNAIPFHLFLVLITVFTAVISGVYPAIMLTSAPLSNSLKSNATIAVKSPFVRKTLVLVQSVISVTLIACTMVLYMQMMHMKKINLGITKDNIIIGYFQLSGEKNAERYAALKTELLQNQAVEAVSWSHNAPFYRGEWWNVNIEGRKINEKFFIQHNHVDYDFMKTFGIKLIKGRGFSPAIPADTIGTCIINMKAAETFGWGENAIGKYIYNDSTPYKVIGIMNNYYIKTIIEPIDPVFLSYTTRKISWPNTHIVRIRAGEEVIEVKNWVTKKYRQYFPEANLEFMDYYKLQYHENFNLIEVLNFLLGLFSLVSIIIASFGLYGLVSFVTRRRTKEIGIRKVNGARIFDIYKIIAKEFIYLLVLANLISMPLSYFISQKILINFTNHVTLNIPVFMITFAISLVITLLTISIEIIKASKVNPVECLRYE